MDDEKLYSQVKTLLKKNTVSGHSRSKDTDYTFIKPSSNHYTFQYFWDCCFHVFMLTTVDEADLAKKCLRTLFAMQTDEGFVGHIHYWNNTFPARATDILQNNPGIGINLIRSHMSSLIQPPMAAQALQRIWECAGDEEYLRYMLPQLKTYYDWLAKYRDFDGDGLLTIITSFESGMDWKPAYDEVVGFEGGRADRKLFWKMIRVDFCNFLRGYDTEKIKKKDRFRVKDAGFNTIYYLNLVVLADLCEKVGDHQAQRRYTERAEKVKTGITEQMWDEEDAAFYDVAGNENKKLKVLTPTIFFPCAIDSIGEKYSEMVLKRHYFNREEFQTEFPIPSVAANHPSFNPGESMYLWRGPTWIFNNWFLYKHILKKEYPSEAEHLVKVIKQIIEKSGFREYYNPFTGEGEGAMHFTWSCLIVDMI